jgi:hypothetical protein
MTCRGLLLAALAGASSVLLLSYLYEGFYGPQSLCGPQHLKQGPSRGAVALHCTGLDGGWQHTVCADKLIHAVH